MTIENVLVSVADKAGLSDFAGRLSRMGISILATGGTGRFLESEGIAYTNIAEITGRVEVLGGLVKTLHTGLHAGILADRGDQSHMAELASLGFRKIDMVVVNFYPLADSTGRHDLSFIDIGGPAMARAAAKNFRSCVPVSHPSWYERVAAELEAGGDVSEDLRWRLATDALGRTGAYDGQILSVVPCEDASRIGADSLLCTARKVMDLRYGENPHQRAAFYSLDGSAGFEILKGELSYNNLLDIDCCLSQLGEFDTTAAVVVKHVGPCGVAEAHGGLDALDRAYACDPMSAFGGVIGVNFRFDEACARLLAKRFVECVAAPDFDEAALALLEKKKRTRLVAFNKEIRQRTVLRTAIGGVLVQGVNDTLFTDELKFVSGPQPDQTVIDDLVFAWKAVKHVKSNAIVLAKVKRTIGIGAGQPSRVDAAKIAIRKATEFGHDLGGSVMASDGFFPFPDSIELAAGAGIAAVIQPGGSIRDKDVIARAEALGLTMALTSTRHFRH
jgi:phosphoribosylaminoimidazolecarboxamide formyltransferase/IMP cyclohydrolase